MVDRNSEVPYYRTVPSSPEPDDDEVLLPGEDDVIELSPQIPSADESIPKISDNKAEGSSGTKEDNDEEEALLRRRLLEKKREKERQVEKQQKPEERKKMTETKDDQKQRRKEEDNQKPDQANANALSTASSTKPKRERIVWNKGNERQRDEKTGGSESDSIVIKNERERHKLALKESEQQKSERLPSSSSSALAATAKKREIREEKKNFVETSSGSRVEDKHKRPKSTSSATSSSDRHHHRHQRNDHHDDEPEKDRQLQRREKHQSKEEKRGVMASKKRPRKDVSNSSTEDAALMEESISRKKTAKRDIDITTEGTRRQKEVPKLLETAHVDVSPPIDETVDELAMCKPEPPKKTASEKPKRYSKFESSPEPSGDEEEDGKGTAKELCYSDKDEEREERHKYNEDQQQRLDDFPEIMGQQKNAQFYPYEPDEDGEGDGMDETGMDVDVDLPENKEFDELTEEEKAMLSPDKLARMEEHYQKRLISRLPVYYPGIAGCRSVTEYECLNKISEGTFGVVYRAQEIRTDEIVALKRLKMEKEKQGFPITSLREINMLLKCGTHPNVLNVREVVVGSNLDRIYMVMEYLEHDLKSLMDLMKSRKKKWTIPQVKTLLHQLLSGVAHMHEEYVIHRDLKTSNLLLSHRGILKIADFGLAREFGDPLKPYTPVVVTLWYRSPELLLGTKLYSTAVDLWSVGCIFGEFFKLDPMFAGRTEIEQLQKIFKEVGTPNEQVWPGYMELPGMRSAVFENTPYNQLRRKFAAELSDDDGFDLLNGLLRLDPSRRLSAQEALKSKWFHNDPKPAPPSSFPTWPAKSEHNKKPPDEPAAPRKPTAPIGGFTLKFDVPKF